MALALAAVLVVAGPAVRPASAAPVSPSSPVERGTRGELGPGAGLGRCSAAGQGPGLVRGNFWDAVREPARARQCDLLGQATNLLERAPADAHQAASLADRLLPGSAEPWVLRGRASVALRRYDRAVEEFERARAFDPRSTGDPLVLRDLAVAQSRTGRLSEARSTYRSLVPRVTLLPTYHMRLEVLLQAGALALTRGGDEGLQEARALFAEACSYPIDVRTPDAHALLALAMDRAGDADQARVVIEKLRRWELIGPLVSRDLSSFDYFVDPTDAMAVKALLLERTDPRRALELWREILRRSPQAPSAQQARAHVGAMREPAIRRRNGPLRGRSR